MPDFSNMSPEDLERMAREMRESMAGDPMKKIETIPAPVAPPTLAPSQDPYDWSDLAGYDLELPSGRKCFMRDLGVKDVARAGILNQVTRLEGLADKLVRVGNGEPPKPEHELGEKDMIEMTELIEKIIPMAVIKPTISPMPAEGESKVVGKIYPDSISLGDQIAILNRSLGELAKYDSFRK